MLPYEFDPPGTYDTLGMDWTDYCMSYEPATAKYLLEQKLPRAFELGKQLGIQFDMGRRIVETEAVNAGLMAAQRHSQDAAMDFALTMLSAHFEKLRDPNDPELLAETLSRLGVPPPAWVVAGSGSSILQASRARADANRELTLRGRQLSGGGSVPWFSVRCGEDARGVTGSGGGATTPRYFEKLIGTCLTAPQQHDIRQDREQQRQSSSGGEAACDAAIKTDDDDHSAAAAATSATEACDAPVAAALPVLRVVKLSNAEPSCPTGNCEDFTVMEAFTGERTANTCSSAVKIDPK